jgi:hypothetical protein
VNIALLSRRARQSPHFRYQHCALLFSSRLLAWGYNTGTLHAEESALRRLDRIYRPGNTRRPSNLHLVSFMLRRRDGSSGTSEPCEKCAALLREAGVRRVTRRPGGAAAYVPPLRKSGEGGFVSFTYRLSLINADEKRAAQYADTLTKLCLLVDLPYAGKVSYILPDAEGDDAVEALLHHAAVSVCVEWPLAPALSEVR